MLSDAVMVLFLKLDLDKIGPVYQNELKSKLNDLDEKFRVFREHVSSSS